MLSSRMGSADLALVDAQHQRSLDDIRQCLHLLVTKHCLEQREDTLCRGRVWSEGKDDLRSLSPRRKLGAIHSPPMQHLLSECVALLAL